MMTSLRARLFVGLALFILATGLIAGSVAYRWAFDEAIELQDAILLQVSSLVVNNRLQTGLPAEGHVDAEARVSIEELGQETAAARAGNAAPHLPPTLPEGLQTIARGQEKWRVLVRTRSDGSRVAVGQPTAGRNEIANGAALRTVLPLAALVPCLMLLVGIVIRYSFLPIAQLAAHLDAKQSGHLEKLPLDGMPAEMTPFIASINRLLARIEMMFEQQRRFVADAAHELRSPITALSVQAENLDQASFSQDSRERLNALRNGIRRVAHLLEQLLALAKYEMADLPHAPATALDQIAKTVVSDFLPLAHAHGIDLGFERFERVSVMADATALAVLVRNLVDNALRYTPESGRINISVFANEGRGVFRIDDTGPGLAEEDLARIFEPFYRGQSAVGEGTGLGLSIVRRIVGRFAGSISVENIVAPNRTGLCFVVGIPLAEHATQTTNGSCWQQ
jgi:two-component system OmpR family sensor kinase